MWGVAQSTYSYEMHEHLAYTFPTVSRMGIRIDSHYLALLDSDPSPLCSGPEPVDQCGSETRLSID
jgi:hypothetical protein